MKKIAILVLLICIGIGITYGYPANSTISKEMHMGDMMLRAFEAGGGEAEGYWVHNWSVLNDTYLSMDSLTNIAQQMNKTIQISDPQEYKNSEGNQHVYQLYGKWNPATSVSIILTSMNLAEHPQQTVAVIKIERETGQLQDIVESIEKVKKAIADAGGNPQISTCIKGFYNDRIEITGQNQLLDRVFAKINAKEIEGVRSESLMSVSGYSPLAQEYINTNGKKMNVQVAIHYDAYQKKSRILVGSPIITIEY